MSIIYYCIKKIKHFSKKEPFELLEKYAESIIRYNYSDEDDETCYVKETLITAMGTALIQSEKGIKLLEIYSMGVYEDEDKDTLNFMDEEMPWFVYPMCQAKREEYFWLIFRLYMTNMDFIAYKDNCDYYFSSIYNEKLFEYYTKFLRRTKKEDLQDYYYDIAEYLNSTEIDDILLKTLKTNVSREIKENIIRILACKFDTRVIPFAIQYVQEEQFTDEECLKMALAPMLIINKCEDFTSREIIKYVKKMIME